jgi:hypothetical protein
MTHYLTALKRTVARLMFTTRLDQMAERIFELEDKLKGLMIPMMKHIEQVNHLT